MDAYAPTHKTRLGRYPTRGAFDKAQIHSILDEGFLCHVGFVVDGQPFVIPTGYARSGECIYFHGSAASRMLRAVDKGVDVCVTVTLLDGLVLARSGFHHSMNYRSVVVLGKARLVTDAQEKVEALRAFTNHVVPGRWEEVRPPTEQELKATSVLALPLEEVSAKMRSGPPIDDDEDYSLPIWAGVVPMRPHIGEPVSDGRVPAGVPPFDTGRFLK
jgi:nitroimidazol reductase NimA-like FMN-containing flavoprotein (pyridoxamine 5'-phosphate oxidase superfamily)